ncbi:GPW/gp25 family protein [Diaphorobacter sp. NR2-3-3-1]|nr:GPW/gp25 family protein [Diaphorobacter caeni]
MNRNTGQRINMLEHVRQSVTDILSTPIGSRVMRRTYGSLVPALIDQPDNLSTQTRVFSAVASALMRWEPRIKVSKMSLTRDADVPGRVTINIDCAYTGQFSRDASLSLSLSLSVPLNGGAA